MGEPRPEEVGERAYQQFMDMFIVPAVTKRQAAGELPTPLRLLAAQVVFSPDAKPPEVRINEQVRAYLTVPNAEFAPGQLVYASQVSEISELRLVEDDGDCGHVTILWLPKRTSDVLRFPLQSHAL